ncbi:hypothetical protein ACX12L_11070 [Alicycliphilus sp. T452]
MKSNLALILLAGLPALCNAQQVPAIPGGLPRDPGPSAQRPDIPRNPPGTFGSDQEALMQQRLLINSQTEAIKELAQQMKLLEQRVKKLEDKGASNGH